MHPEPYMEKGTLQIKAKDFEIQRSSWNIWVLPTQSHELLKAYKWEKSQINSMWEGVRLPLLALKMEEGDHKSRKEVSSESGNDSQFTVWMITRTSVLQPQGTEFCQPPECVGNIFPEPLEKKQPADLILVHWELCQTCDLKNYNLCCLSLWVCSNLLWQL